MWQPEIGPTAYAIASSESPNANATPRLPICLPAITAAPTPPNTRTNVPTNSAPARLSDIATPLGCSSLRFKPPTYQRTCKSEQQRRHRRNGAGPRTPELSTAVLRSTVRAHSYASALAWVRRAPAARRPGGARAGGSPGGERGGAPPRPPPP